MDKRFVESGALFSADRAYRYLLWRVWDTIKPSLCCIGLNPSKANETEGDATIGIVYGRGRRLGCGSLVMANTHALVSTDPRMLFTHPHPVSHPDEPQRNLNSVLAAAIDAAFVICAWGTHELAHEPGRQIVALLKQRGIQPYALRINRDGSPAHPLRIPYSEPLKPFA